MQPLVSFSLIVRNEEAKLPACLESIASIADEIIIIDTGSADRTKEVAASFGAKVFDFPWIDDFAAARNECIRHGTGEWIFWLGNKRGHSSFFCRIKGDIHLFFDEKGSIQGQQPAPAIVINRMWPRSRLFPFPSRRSRPRNSISRGDETEFRGVLKQTLVYEGGGGVGEVLAEEF
jgi:hypothetical protein